MKIFEELLACFAFGLMPLAWLSVQTNIKYKFDDLRAATSYAILIFILATPLEHVTTHMMAWAFHTAKNPFCLLLIALSIGIIEEFLKFRTAIQFSERRGTSLFHAAALIGCLTGDLESILYSAAGFDTSSVGPVLDGCLVRPFFHAALSVSNVLLYSRIANRLPFASFISSLGAGALHALYNLCVQSDHEAEFSLSVLTAFCVIYMFFVIMRGKRTYDPSKNRMILFYTAFLMMSLTSLYFSSDRHEWALNMIPISAYSVFLLSKSLGVCLNVRTTVDH